PHVQALPGIDSAQEEAAGPEHTEMDAIDPDEQKIRDRIGDEATAAFVIRVMQGIKQIDGRTLTVASAAACGLPGTTIHSYATSWGSAEKRGAGTRELWLSKEKVLRYVVSKWNPRSTKGQ
ncbi:MAG TPA: hypothetical protein VK843_16690, partial [Planctomycetota bacterium]|nr:hypothetical protein [Planctomycetota bacterium]